MELHLAAHMELLLLLFGLLEFLPVDSQAQWQVWYYFVQTISKVNYHWDRILLLIVRVILLFLLGTYAGQYAMQGFLNLNWAPWKILVITRSYVYMFILIMYYVNYLLWINLCICKSVRILLNWNSCPQLWNKGI